ncbi:hypothetical protein [Actinocorallia herbida]|uniref:hypothetical protein n=1 Tax=Actinocorallia herbida TaxID=58109 RepID=UPI000F4CCECA|nr:hypothetical protein [Actinocorallia herbida]
MAQRVVGAVGTVAVAAVVNVGTTFLTDGALVWWVSGGALLLVGVLVQWFLPVGEGRDPGGSRRAGGSQYVRGNKAGGSIRVTMTGTGEQRVSGNEAQGEVTVRQGADPPPERDRDG